MLYYYLFFLSLGLSLLLTPLVERLAYRLQFLDVPDGRKRHRVPVPLLGGVAVYISFFVTLSFGYAFQPEALGPYQPMYLGMLLGGTLIFLAGLLDDAYGLKAPQKFAVQILAAVVFIYFHDPVNVLQDIFPDLHHTLLVRFLGILFFVFWVVMLTNAINLIDGLDGLATGISFLGAYFLMLAAIGLGRDGLLPFLLPLLGATLGFLRYNFNPARIFLGDTGSMLLGYLLAVISFQGFGKRITLITLFVPILLLGLPILDTVLSFTRRILAGRNPFSADRDHIHHKMIRLGLTQAQAVTILYIVCTGLGILSLSMMRFTTEIVVAIAVPLGALLLGGLYSLGYFRPGVQTKISFREKRTLPRSLKEVVVEYRRGKETRYAISRDFSKGGLFLRTQHPAAVGEEFLLRFTDPATRTEKERRGRVVWNTSQGNTPLHDQVEGMGIMFLD